MLPLSLVPQLARAIWIAILMVLAAGGHADAQLRPLDPTNFEVLRGEPLRFQLGAGIYFDQHASLAGTRGRLLEVGNVRTSWRTGRVVLEIAGTVQRFFSDEVRVQPAADGVSDVAADGERHDAGDYRVQTLLRLSGDSARTTFMLRFGTRLPTTDNRTGLERDQTDFFTAFGVAHPLGTFNLSAEAGLAINGTRVSTYEQSDVLIYAATIAFSGRIAPFIAIAGQQDFRDRQLRGNEDLGEVRGGIRVGQKRWVTAMFVGGYHQSSPQSGFVLNAGFATGGQPTARRSAVIEPR